MRVELCVEQRALKRWHVELVRTLGGRSGVEVGVRWAAPSEEPPPACVAALFALERLLHSVPLGLLSPAEPPDLTAYVGRGGTNPEIVIDIAGGTPTAGQRRWRLTYDGAGGEQAALAAILEGRAPLVAVVDTESGRVVAQGRPRTEAPHIAVVAMQEVVAGTATVILSAVEEKPTPLYGAVEGALELSCADAAAFGARELSRAVADRISQLLGRRPVAARRRRLIDRSSGRSG